jgi:integrase
MISDTYAAWDARMASDGYSENTRRARIQAVDAIAYYSGVDPTRITDYHVRRYLTAKALKPRSRLAYLQHLAAWAKFAGVPDPTAGVRRPPTPRSLPNPLPEHQLQLLLQRVEGDERCWVLLGAYAGLRAHEVAKLHADDFADGTLRVRGKGSHVDALPIAPVLAAALAPHALRGGPCWPGITSRQVSARIKARARSAGIRMRFHMLRHRFGTALYQATHDLLLTQRLMRHASPQTTAGYAAVADARSTQVVSSLPGADDREPYERMIA